MTTFTDIRDSVVAITNRPDLQAEMKTAIRKAVMKFHLADTFKRDLLTTTLDMTLYPSSNFRWDIDLANSSVFPRYRKYYFLRVPTYISNPPVTNPLAAFRDGWYGDYSGRFEAIDPANLFDGYNLERQNYFYEVGMTLTLRASYAPTTLEFGYYSYPGVANSSETELTLISWIASQFPDAIAEEAAGTIFKMIGKDDESARYQQLFAENIAFCRSTDIGN